MLHHCCAASQSLFTLLFNGAAWTLLFNGAACVQEADVCYACGATGSAHAPKAEKLLACQGCNHLRYCSRNCQRRDWKSHKELCSAIKQEREELGGNVNRSEAWHVKLLLRDALQVCRRLVD
jgi:MYND finger